jgi:hypothetical protein
MEGHANLGVSSLLIVDKLDVVRKMVSSACSAPLPLDRDKQELSLLPPLVQEAIGGLVGADEATTAKYLEILLLPLLPIFCMSFIHASCSTDRCIIMQ